MSSPFFNPYEDFERHRFGLPHWQQGEVWQFVTWRLADAMPVEKLNEWRLERESWLLNNPPPWSPDAEREFHQLFRSRVEKWLDRGHGCCALREPKVAAIVEGALRHFDGARYRLGPYVIMPNHVHVLFHPLPGFALKGILHTWKGFTAKEVNKILGSAGKFWQDSYWDRMVRSEQQWYAYRNYIERNPQSLRPGTFVLGVGSRSEPI
jgi:hypothetical protein